MKGSFKNLNICIEILFNIFKISQEKSFSAKDMSFTLKCRTSSLVIISSIYIISTTIPIIVTLLCFCASTVTLFPGLYSTICHYVCSFIEILGTTCSVFSYSFEFFVCWESIINCNYVKYDEGNYYSTHKSRRFLYETTCPMGISFNSFSSFYFIFSFLISLYFSFTHIRPVIIISLFHIVVFYLFSFSAIGFINFILLWFRMIFVLFISIRVNISSITFTSW